MMMQPAAEHLELATCAGSWNVECHYYMSPTGEPIQVEATEKIEMLGPFFATSHFEASMMGMPFQGKATIGYNVAGAEWVSTWIDTMNPFLFHFTGNKNADGVLEMKGQGPSPVTGDLTTYRTTQKEVGEGREFEMFYAMPDGTEAQLAKYIYTRA